MTLLTEQEARDIVNAYFKQFYPHDLSDKDFRVECLGTLGPMRHYLETAYSRIFPRMVCADGFTMSVQGHCGAYSSPRDDFADHYTEVEVGFPSEREELLMPYIDAIDPETVDSTGTVYGYVPISVIEQVIEKHGGLVGPEDAA